MMNEDLIVSYANQLAQNVEELGKQFNSNTIELPLDDSTGRFLSLTFWSGRSRVTGCVLCNGQSVVRFELKIRPRFIEFSHPKAGPMGTLRVSVKPCAALVQEPLDRGSTIAKLATRLQHFSIFKRMRLGIRQSNRPPALSA